MTTNANSGPLSWADRTGPINSQAFPISAIGLDSTDPTGKTAYVTVMGFHTAHVWKTTNAGLTWTDFSANLPDVPVNSIIVDSGASLLNGTVYAGTDIGVFASSTGVANWSELAPVEPGQPGLLPSVAVTSLKIFNSDGLKRLRAATYGRGIWEWNLITTDFQIQVTNNPAAIFAGQIASFDAKIYSLNNYRNLVGLSCTQGTTNPPQICTPLTPMLPSIGGTPLAVNVGGAVGDYLFNLHAVGSDPLALTHDFALTLRIVDFSFAAPLPAAVSVCAGRHQSADFSGVICSGIIQWFRYACVLRIAAGCKLPIPAIHRGAPCRRKFAHCRIERDDICRHAIRNISHHHHCFDAG